MYNLRWAWFGSLSEYGHFDFISQLEVVVTCVATEEAKLSKTFKTKFVPIM